MDDAYYSVSERLLEDAKALDWPISTIEQQRNWIGRSEGADVIFEVKGKTDKIRVFTTRPDTLFGATYMVLAPEHPLVDVVSSQEQKENIQQYRKETASKSELERGTEKEKTGVFTGGFAINPTTGKEIPIWIADYVLMGYGTGAIMAVPGHDERDMEFAKKFNLEIIKVVDGGRDAAECFIDDGIAINSANNEVSLNGLSTPEAKKTIISWLEKKELGKFTVTYKLRDWLFSRQRYTGANQFQLSIWKMEH